MAYGFTRICDECVAKSSTGRAPDYIFLFCIRSLEWSSKGVINHLIDNGFHFGMVKGLGKMIL